MEFQPIQIYDPNRNVAAKVSTDGKLETKTEIGFSGDIQLGSVEIKDHTTDNRANVYADASGDFGLATVPMSINPLHTSQINPSYIFTRNGSGYLTKIQMAITGTTYTKDFARDANNYVTGVTAWY